MSSTLISDVHLLTVPMADQRYLGTPGQLCVDDAVVCLRVPLCVSGGVCGTMWVLHDCDRFAIRGGKPSLSLLHCPPPLQHLDPGLRTWPAVRRALRFTAEAYSAVLCSRRCCPACSHNQPVFSPPPAPGPPAGSDHRCHQARPVKAPRSCDL